MTTKHFRLDTWQILFPFLRKGMFACKIDLKDAYFHLALAKELQPYLTLKVEDQFYQFQSVWFGLSPLPEIWQGVMNVFAKK